MLTTSERIHLKKRVIDVLAGEMKRDVDLTLDEYGFQQSEYIDERRDYVLARINAAPDDHLVALDRHLFPNRYPDEEPAMATLLEGQDNTPFSQDEQVRIAEVVSQVLKQAKETYGLPQEQMHLLEAKLNYLVEAAPHSRRIDWLNITLSAVGGAFAGGVLTPDVVHKVLTALGAGLGPLFGHPTPLLGP
jgi:hypothetical protein